MDSLRKMCFQGLLVIILCQLIMALPTSKPTTPHWMIEDEVSLLDKRLKNISNECYISQRECNVRCSVVCDEVQECDGISGTFYQCAFNYWLVIILMVIIGLFLVILLVACQCVDKGQGCGNVELYPRILGNYRRSQRRGINTVQYFTSVRAGARKESIASQTASSINQHRASISSQTPLTTSVSNYRYL